MLNFFLGVVVALICVVIVAVTNENVPFFAQIKNNLATFQAIGSLAIACSAIVAFFIYRDNTNRHIKDDKYRASEIFLNESIKVLERSFEMFTDNRENVSPPRNDRLLWLTTARMMLRFKILRSNVSEKEHVEICDEHEEYWRFQFYNLLAANKDNFTKEYYNPNGAIHSGGCIARNSMAVIFDFSRWNEEVSDPMDEVNDKELFAKGAIPITQFGAVEFLEENEKYWGEVQKIKAALENDS